MHHQERIMPNADNNLHVEMMEMSRRLSAGNCPGSSQVTMHMQGIQMTLLPFLMTCTMCQVGNWSSSLASF